MKDLQMKQGILKEIMGLMDSREGDRLKGHPKFVKASIDVVKPDALEKDEDPAEEALESPDMEKKEGDEELSPEMIQMLLDKFKGLK